MILRAFTGWSESAHQCKKLNFILTTLQIALLQIHVYLCIVNWKYMLSSIIVPLLKLPHAKRFPCCIMNFLDTNWSVCLSVQSVGIWDVLCIDSVSSEILFVNGLYLSDCRDVQTKLFVMCSKVPVIFKGVWYTSKGEHSVWKVLASLLKGGTRKGKNLLPTSREQSLSFKSNLLWEGIHISVSEKGDFFFFNSSALSLGYVYTCIQSSGKMGFQINISLISARKCTLWSKISKRNEKNIISVCLGKKMS